MDLCPTDTLGRRIWGQKFQCWFLVASQHTQCCGFPSSGSSGFVSSVFTPLWDAVSTVLEDVAQGRRGWGGWDPVWFIPMLHWKGAATTDRQTCSALTFPILWSQLRETRREEDRLGKKQVWGCWPVSVCLLFVKLVVIKSQHKLQLLIISAVIRKSCS